MGGELGGEAPGLGHSVQEWVRGACPPPRFRPRRTKGGLGGLAPRFRPRHTRGGQWGLPPGLGHSAFN